MPILAAVDRSERAEYVVREAAKLAREFDEPIHAVHVLSTQDFVELERTSVETEDEAIDMDSIRLVAADIADKTVSDLDVEYESIGLIGDAADEIIGYASDHNAEYIVISPRRRSPAGKALFGSTAQKVIINADCPIVSTSE